MNDACGGWGHAADMLEHHIICSTGRAQAREYRGPGPSVVFMANDAAERRLYQDMILGLLEQAHHVVILALGRNPDPLAGIFAAAIHTLGLNDFTIVTQTDLKDLAVAFSREHPGRICAIWVCGAIGARICVLERLHGSQARAS